MKTFHPSVLRRLPRLNVDYFNLPLRTPRQKMPAGELRRIVAANHLRHPAATWDGTRTAHWRRSALRHPFNSPDTQNCTYVHDDLQRLQKANCGTAWGQSFGFDVFGNITKSVLAGSTGISWQPTYTHGTTNTNQYFSLPGFTPTYDANGNLLTDSFHTYTWDAEGKMISLDSTTLTYDALGRMVEQNQSGTYFQIVYSPTGKKLAIMKAQVIQQAFVPLPGKAKAEYLSWGLSHYRHPDWLGSARLESSTAHGIIQSVAYDAFGVPYAQKSGGNGEISFTGQNKDTAWLQYDFLDRQYDPTQGRWISPDRAGLSAVDPTSPQSWNRYAYVQNNPLAMVDPFGDDGCYDPQGSSISGVNNSTDCRGQGGHWVHDGQSSCPGCLANVSTPPGCSNNACAPDPNPAASCIANCGPPSPPAAGCPSGQTCSGTVKAAVAAPVARLFNQRQGRKYPMFLQALVTVLFTGMELGLETPSMLSACIRQTVTGVIAFEER